MEIPLWDADAGRCERVFDGHPADLLSASFSADGGSVLTCGWLGGIRGWPLA